MDGMTKTQIFAEFVFFCFFFPPELFICWDDLVEKSRKAGCICRGRWVRGKWEYTHDLNSHTVKHPSTHVLGDRRSSEMFGDLELVWHFD